MVGKYNSYPQYAYFSSEYIGLIPLGWSRTVVGAVSDVIDPQPDHRAPSLCREGEGFPYIGIRDINGDGSLNFDTARKVEEAAVIKQEASFQIEPNDIVFCKVGTLGLPRKIKPHDRFALSATLVLIKTKKIFDSQYFLYALDSDVVKSQTNLLATGSTRAALGIQQIRKFQIPLPSRNEQTQIANFLDYETAKIDTLIEKQQQLIKLLKEKRQAVISHAVTKGLNPDVPMKDSGVEWLGDVPEHWGVSQFKFQTLLMQTGPFGSQLHSDDYVENQIPIINPAHIVGGQIVPNAFCTVDKDTQARLSRHKLERGDLILARRGELGRCAVVRATHEGWLCGTGCLKASMGKVMSPDYAYMLISSEGIKVELSLESKGSTMENLNTETLGNIRLPVPPSSEQDAILRFVSVINDKYDELQNLAKKQIELLQERRTALVSAAVTGKIDVRNWQPESTEHPLKASA